MVLSKLGWLICTHCPFTVDAEVVALARAPAAPFHLPRLPRFWVDFFWAIHHPSIHTSTHARGGHSVVITTHNTAYLLGVDAVLFFTHQTARVVDRGAVEQKLSLESGGTIS